MSQSITAQNTFETIARHMLVDVLPFVLNLEKSTGNHLFDDLNGRFYLDCFSFVASNPLGYNHPRLNDPEFERKLLRAAKIKPSNSDIYTVELAEFVDAFARFALPKSFPHLFLIEGGTLGVENALKAAFDWKVRLNFARGESAERGSLVIHFEEAFHGRSGYTLSLTNSADQRKTKYFPKFNWPRFKNPKLRFPLDEVNLGRAVQSESETLNAVRAFLQEHHADTASIVIETIQAEGGDNHFRAEFHQSLRALADEFDVMLIYDEIQCGMGLTGKMWAFEHFGVEPDMFAFGKKTQVCGFACTRRIEKVENHVFAESSRLNSTWGGSLADMIRAMRYLEIISEEKLVENAALRGAELLAGLEAAQARCPQLISNARGRGLMCAFDLPSPEARSHFLATLRECGAILLPCGRQSIRLRPALTFSAENVSELLGILERACAEESKGS